MFTGIIEEIGNIKSIAKKGRGLLIEVDAPLSNKEIKLGDSVAVNGVCQTVIKKSKSTFIVEAVEETLKKTNFSQMKKGYQVNIELPLKTDGRFGGHIVLGHVDTVGEIINIEKRTNSTIYQVKYQSDYKHFVVKVGSIAIDGISLTIAEVKNNTLSVSIIPHTLANTIMKSYKVGTRVNLEFDIIGKYVAQIMNSKISSSDNTLTLESLKRSGY
ncbi:MAG: riboflavin synthase [Ignavibacteriales bacterium]|nr:riboflavin synthase [Ignavibacteriales bacterium]